MECFFYLSNGEFRPFVDGVFEKASLDSLVAEKLV